MSVAQELPYVSIAGHYDEMALPTGELRPAWRELMAALHGLGDNEFLRRWQEAQRLIEEHGVTYNVYGDPRGMNRPWQLDPIPMLISSAEWVSIEAAVGQRATLLDRMLADLYGERRLLLDGHLPPELVFAHPGFLRPCHGIRPPGDAYLHVYAADLARSPDGRWWVIGDRTQAPSGAGYALENRVVMSRILPELFQDFYVQRLARSFQTYREMLTGLAPQAGDEPRVVLLTPGPYNETYFEHAYLARYLGFTLVEGADLTVRDERVYLKTLSGLLPVDVIVRRQDDLFCDPVELFGGSALGIPGLVQCVRAGTVAVTNTLGSGLVETAAVMAFLPGLCRHLLGEDLRMPSAATWWCGQDREREYVVDHLQDIVVKSAFPGPAREVIFGSELSQQRRHALVERIRATPHRFVAQEQVALSTVPTAAESRTSPRHLLLRVYAFRSGDGYTVMPGGLTRVSPASDSLVVSSQSGGGSKDTWVLADAPVPYVSLMDRARERTEVSRGSFALTSRVADNLLWLGRTSERLDAVARRFRMALRRLSEEPLRAADAPPPDAVLLLAALGHLRDGDEDASAETRVLDALYDPEAPDSPRAAVAQVHRLAWLLRDRMSADAWRVLSRLEGELAQPGDHPALRVSTALERIDSTILSLAAFSGLAMESMTRGLGWRFLEIGRRIERGIQVASLLRAALVRPVERTVRRLENVLEVADSTMTYRSRYLGSVELPLVLDLLLLDEANPRAVAFQLVRLESGFRSLHKAPLGLVRELLERVRGASLDELAHLAEDDPGLTFRPALESVLQEIERVLPQAHDALNHAYLSHALARRRAESLAGGPG